MIGILALLAAACGAAAVGIFSYRLLNAPAGPSRALGGALGGFLGGRSQGAVNRLGGIVVARLPFGSLEAWRKRLYWAQINGALEGWTIEGAVGVSVLGILGGLLGLLILRNTMLGLAGAIVAAYPFVQIHAESETAMRQVRRTLPEVAAMLAAELAAGSAVERAVALLATWPGPVGAVMREALEESRRTGRPLFSRGAVRGAFVERLSELGEPALATFASQVDLVASKGAAGAGLMASIASTLAQDYYGEVLIRSENLDNQLTVPAVLFFFLPLLVLIVVPLVLSALSSF